MIRLQRSIPEPVLFAVHQAGVIEVQAVKDYAAEPKYPDDSGKFAEINNWSLQDGRKLNSQSLPDAVAITAVCASTDRRQLVISCHKSVFIANISEGIVLRTLLRNARYNNRQVAFGAGGRQLVVAKTDYWLYLTDVIRGQMV
jgi:hypothetical protein